MINRLFMDLAKCAELSGHGCINEHREIVTLLATDRNHFQREIVADRTVDLNPEQVPDKINKIYDAFYEKPNDVKWDKRIIAFEYVNQVDFYRLLSYLYMINDNGDPMQRSLKTLADAASILSDINMSAIEGDAGYHNYLQQLEVQAKLSRSNKDEKSIRETIDIIKS